MGMSSLAFDDWFKPFSDDPSVGELKELVTDTYMRMDLEK